MFRMCFACVQYMFCTCLVYDFQDYCSTFDILSRNQFFNVIFALHNCTLLPCVFA